MSLSKIALSFLVLAGLASAAPINTICPNVGANTTGCELLITVTAVDGAGAATAWTVTTNSPDLGPFDGTEDTLVGILNNASGVLKTITLSGMVSGLGIFAFDGDGACGGSGISALYSPAPTLAQCGLAAYTFTDPADYQSAGATFSGVNVGGTTGTVNVNLANGASTWFDLEGPVTAQVISSATPEPGSFVLLAIGLAGGVLTLRGHRHKQNVARRT